MRCWTQATTLPVPFSERMERGRVLWKMVGPDNREGECRRRADVLAERAKAASDALHAALRRRSFGHKEAVAGRAGGPWERVRRDERRPGRLGRVIGHTHPTPTPANHCREMRSGPATRQYTKRSVGVVRIWVVKVTASFSGKSRQGGETIGGQNVSGISMCAFATAANSCVFGASV